MRLIRAAALSAAVIAVAATSTTAANATTRAPWDNDGGLVFAGDRAEEPTAPGDVWSALHDREPVILGTGGAGRHTCVIDAQGSAACLGYSARGKLGIGTKYDTTSAAAVSTDGVLKAKTLTGISTGGEHSCAVSASGKAYCWGASNRGQVGSGTTRRSVYDPTAVTTSGVLSGKTLTAISAGGQHTCALSSSGRAFCWGRGSAGQLGNGSTVDAKRPTRVDTTGVLSGKTLIALDAGTNHTCAVASTGAAFCWGAGAQGQLGNSSKVSQATPVKVTGTGANLAFGSITAGHAHTCALTATGGGPFCWGEGAQGRLGTGTTDDHTTPTAVPALQNRNLRSITASDAHTCAVTGNRDAYCWGAGADGQLGNGLRSNALAPVKVATNGFGTDLPDAVAATPHGTCALGLSGTLYCWGRNETTASGGSTTTPTALTTDASLLDGKVIRQLTDDAIHTCALTGAGVAYCWGYGGQGQLGSGVRSSNYRPQPVLTSGALSGVKLRTITAGEYHTCAVSAAGKAYCWGNGEAGQIGDGNARSRLTPRAVDASGVLKGKTLVDITAGDVFTCALDSEGKAYCWGGGGQGQLGNGTMSTSTKPVRVDTSGVLQGKTLVAIDAGYAHACALDSAGKTYCWGSNVYGSLGSGGTKNRASPVAVDTTGVLAGVNVTALSSGDATTCAVSSAGRVYCWGDGTTGQLGDGTTASRNSTPHAVDASGALSGVTVRSVSVGGRATCALSSGGRVYCWGSSFAGQLGYGGYRTKTRPVAMYTGGTLARARVTQVATGRSTWMLTAQR